MSPLTSRRFWTFIVAQLVAIATLVIGHYVTDPFGVQLSGLFIGLVEGVAGILIVSYTVDDMATNAGLIASGDHPVQVANKIASSSGVQFKVDSVSGSVTPDGVIWKPQTAGGSNTSPDLTQRIDAVTQDKPA